MSKICHLRLTCSNEKEADKVANALLVKHLVACVRQMPVSSSYWWKGEGLRSRSSFAKATEDSLLGLSKKSAKEGKIEKNNEVLLEMLSRLDYFEQIEKAVTKLHSYDTFVLEALPVSKISKDAQKWLSRELKNG